MKNQKGITLLVLTIMAIVLLIIAAVAVGAALGDNGIIKNTISAKEKSEEKYARELIETDIYNRRNEKVYNELNNTDIEKIFVKYGTVVVKTESNEEITVVKNGDTHINSVTGNISSITITLESGKIIDVTDIYIEALK